MVLIFALPFLVWRLGRTEYFAPLVVVQIVTGIVLGPGILGAVFPAASTFTALLLMAVGSTMLTIPVVTQMLARLRHLLGKTD